jgi:DNA primase
VSRAFADTCHDKDWMIPDSFKQDLLNRVDIVDVINSRVPLKKAGANWSACCPFHGEKTPSFTVSPTKQFYHCFGCGAHGNAIGFLMEYAGLGYVDAMRDLAEGVGMRLPEISREARARYAEGEDPYELLQRATQYYREQLKNAPAAIDYLKGRGLSGKVAARFGIGYAPGAWQNLGAVFERYADKALVECGLVIEGDQGKRYDRFRDRIMFPITNQRGAVIGFGGRTLGKDDGPKYMNSPETELFQKGRELYGVVQAREAIRASNRVLVVEGYMDVVALAQHGVENAVATLGTATTLIHVQKLLKLADEVVFCFDGDTAGRRAAWHALEVSLEALSDKKALKFLFLPAEDDPDSYVRAHGAKAFEEQVADAQALSAYLLTTLRKNADLSSLEGRSKLIAEAKPLFKRVAAPGLQLQLVKALAEMTEVSQGEVARLTEIRLAAGGGFRRPVAEGPARSSADSRVERELLRCLLLEPELVSRVDIELVNRQPTEGAALAALIEMLQAEPALEPALLWERFKDTPYSKLVEDLQGESIAEAASAEDLNTVVADAVEAQRHRRRKQRIEELLRKGQMTPEEEREYGELSTASRGRESAEGAGLSV